MTFLLNSFLAVSLMISPVSYDPEKKGDQLRVGDFILKHNYAREDNDPRASAGELLCSDNMTVVPIDEEQMNIFIQPVWAHNKEQEWKNLKQYDYTYFYQTAELPEHVFMTFYHDPVSGVKKVFTYDLIKASDEAQKIEDGVRALCDKASTT